VLEKVKQRVLCWENWEVVGKVRFWLNVNPRATPESTSRMHNEYLVTSSVMPRTTIIDAVRRYVDDDLFARRDNREAVSRPNPSVTSTCLLWEYRFKILSVMSSPKIDRVTVK